ncbi:MAG: SDR family oxidoreductase [Thaumarchaeota archaeon]|nr:SDR family oxidoreductase [Nitrososphaerota archaeon]
MNFLTGFKDRTALVTGGGRGIGRATSILLAQLGTKVAVNYVSNDNAAKQTLIEIKSRGGEAFLIKGDVSKQEDVDRIVKETMEQYQAIDILVNCAGVIGYGAIEEASKSDWDRNIRINMTGTFLMCKAVVPIMKMKHYGKIVNMSSLAGVTAGMSSVHYSASKAGVMGFTRRLAVELAPYGIATNCVAPGMIETDMVSHRLATLEGRKRVEQMHPVGRIGSPHEVACLIAYLASQEAGFIIGETVNINGGRFVG